MSTETLIDYGIKRDEGTKEYRWVGVFAIVLLALCVTGIAQAQTATRVTPCAAATPNNAICVTWTQDGKDTGSNPITGVTFRVTQKVGSGTATTVANNITANQFYATGLAPGSYTFVVYANCTGCTGEAASSPASATATPIPVIPNAPVIIIAATIRADGPPTYRIIQSVTLRPNEVVFSAPAAMRSLFVSR